MLGLLGGCIWGIGTTFNLVAGGKVGLPISYAIGQASPMVATLWGVFVWNEFRGASARKPKRISRRCSPPMCSRSSSSPAPIAASIHLTQRKSIA